MDDENYYEVQRIFRKKWVSKKVDFLLNEVYPGQDTIVPDAWYSGEDGFDRVCKMLMSM